MKLVIEIHNKEEMELAFQKGTYFLATREEGSGSGKDDDVPKRISQAAYGQYLMAYLPALEYRQCIGVSCSSGQKPLILHFNIGEQSLMFQPMLKKTARTKR